MPLKNYYKVLQVSRAARPMEIKRAYRDLSKQFHPDAAGNTEGVEQFQDINEAYRILSNKFNKAIYDSYLDFLENPEVYQEKEPVRHETRSKPDDGFSDYLAEKRREKKRVDRIVNQVILVILIIIFGVAAIDGELELEDTKRHLNWDNYQKTTAQYQGTRVDNRTREGKTEYLLRKQYKYIANGDNWYFTRDRSFITYKVVEEEVKKGVGKDTLLTIYYLKEDPSYTRLSLMQNEEEMTEESARLYFHSMTVITLVLVFFLINVSVSKDYR